MHSSSAVAVRAWLGGLSTVRSRRSRSVVATVAVPASFVMQRLQALMKTVAVAVAVAVYQSPLLVTLPP